MVYGDREPAMLGAVELLLRSSLRRVAAWDAAPPQRDPTGRVDTRPTWFRMKTAFAAPSRLTVLPSTQLRLHPWDIVRLVSSHQVLVSTLVPNERIEFPGYITACTPLTRRFIIRDDDHEDVRCS